MTPATSAPADRERPDRRLELAIARLLTVGTYVSVAFLAAGAVGMLLSGISPLAGNAPRFDPRGIPGDLLSLRPAAFLWVGVVVVVGMPASRVAAALLGYVREGDRHMVLVSIAILTVIGLSVALALSTNA